MLAATVRVLVGIHAFPATNPYICQEPQDRVKSVVGLDPVGVVTDITQKNFQRWKAVQEEIIRTISPSGRGDDHNDESPPGQAEKRPKKRTGKKRSSKSAK